MRTAPESPLWLWWVRWRALVNAPRTRDGQSKARLVLFAVLGISFMAGGFFGARWLFGKFEQVEFLADLLIRRSLSLVLYFFSGLLVFSSLVAGFSSLYLSDDLNLLVASPISTRRLFLARFGEVWLQSSWMMLVFALPIAAGCGPALDAPWSFYVALPLLMIPVTVCCAAAGCVGTVALAWLLPARRTQDVLVVLAIFAFLILYVAFRLAEPEKFLDPQGFDQLVSLIGSLKTQGAPLHPIDWLLEALFAVRSEAWAEAALPTVVLITGAAGATFVATWVADALYLRSFSLAQEGRSGNEGGRLARLLGPLVARAIGHSARWRSNPISVLMRRDTRLFLRTTSQWTQLVLISALVVVYVFNFKHFRTLMEAGQVGPIFLFFLNFLLGGLVVTTLAARFLYPSVSLEGRGYWAVSVAPVTTDELLASKVRWGLVPLLVVAEVLAISSGVLSGVPGGLVALSAGLAAVSAWAVAGLAVGLGAEDPRFHEDNPARIASGVGGVVFMFLGLGYLVAMTALLAWPFNAAYRLATTVWTPRPGQWVQGTALILAAVALTLITHLWPRRRGARKLAAREG